MNCAVNVYQARDSMKIRDHSMSVYRYRGLLVMNRAIISYSHGYSLFQYLGVLDQNIRIIYCRWRCYYSLSTRIYNQLEHINWTADAAFYLSQDQPAAEKEKYVKFPFTFGSAPSMVRGALAVGA